jgi:hypothetical protein
VTTKVYGHGTLTTVEREGVMRHAFLRDSFDTQVQG